MPAGDQTGPEGMGPMTGRGAGICAGVNTPQNMGRGMGRGFGRSRGMGRGMGRGFGHFGAPSREQQVDALKAQALMLESDLNMIAERIKALEVETTE